MKHFLGKRLTKLWRDRTGGIFVFAAIAAPVMIGAAGLSVDIGLWYANKRLAQSAVDSAALAGALELRRSVGDPTSIENVVNADALINGFSAANGDIIDVDASVSPRVAVTITRTVPGLLSQVLFTETTNVRARAVARADVNDTCIWSLNPTDEKTIEVSGNADGRRRPRPVLPWRRRGGDGDRRGRGATGTADRVIRGWQPARRGHLRGRRQAR